MEIDLRPALDELRTSTIDRCRTEWGGVGRFVDHAVIESATALLRLDGALTRTRLLQPGAVAGLRPRYIIEVVSLAERLAQPTLLQPAARLRRSAAQVGAARGVSSWDLTASQGVADVIRWRGLPVFKTAWEMAVLPMLVWELDPGAIVEIGSGSGGSAMWLSELPRPSDRACPVLSVDITPPDVVADGVEFRFGDLDDVSEALPAELLAALPRPLLVIEDAHVNVVDVLSWVGSHLHSGDHLVVEDSLEKRDDILAFLAAAEGSFMLDTRYVDMFGENVTSATDSHFRVA